MWLRQPEAGVRSEKVCFHKDTWRNVEKRLPPPISQTLRGPSGEAGVVAGRGGEALPADEAVEMRPAGEGEVRGSGGSRVGRDVAGRLSAKL